MNRDFVWLVVVVILASNTLLLLSSEDAVDPNLIDIEDLTCSSGEILVSNTSLIEGYDCTEFDPHSITHAHPAPMLSVSNVIDDGSTIAILGDIDHPHPDEITVRLSLDKGVTISTLPNKDGAWSLIVQSTVEQFYLNITANHNLEGATSDTTIIEINRTTIDDGDGEIGQPQNHSILSAYHGLDQLPLVASVLCGFNVAGDDGMPVVFSTQLNVDSVDPESFLVTRSDGEVVVPNCATLHPADEPLELRTVLLTGDFGTFGETPLRVEVTGPLLTIDGESLLGLSTEDITPLEDGPRVVLAERFAPETPGLAGECPDGTAQVVHHLGGRCDGPRQRRAGGGPTPRDSGAARGWHHGEPCRARRRRPRQPRAGVPSGGEPRAEGCYPGWTVPRPGRHCQPSHRDRSH